ncbi:MAG: UxaA family hydrolase [Acidimicrobiales bacterium]
MSDELDFLGHRKADAVAVAVRDVSAGPAVVGFLDSSERRRIDVAGEIALGHKVALVALEEGDDVVEYGQRIGCARSAILPGQHVHVHNIRSARWQLTA